MNLLWHISFELFMCVEVCYFNHSLLSVMFVHPTQRLETFGAFVNQLASIICNRYALEECSGIGSVVLLVVQWFLSSVDKCK